MNDCVACCFCQPLNTLSPADAAGVLLVGCSPGDPLLNAAQPSIFGASAGLFEVDWFAAEVKRLLDAGFGVSAGLLSSDWVAAGVNRLLEAGFGVSADLLNNDWFPAGVKRLLDAGFGVSAGLLKSAVPLVAGANRLLLAGLGVSAGLLKSDWLVAGVKRLVDGLAGCGGFLDITSSACPKLCSCPDDEAVGSGCC